MAKRPSRKSAAPRSRPYKMKTVKDVYVPMRDGTRIAVAVYRPDAEGEFPTLYAPSPYQYSYDEVPAFPVFTSRETGPIEWYVGNGYVYVRADVRGSGKSEGTYRFFDRTEQEDYYDTVEWIADQRWSNGKVGGMGQSYYAMALWLMAIMKPPHLTCIAPYDGSTDFYRGMQNHGGVFGGFLSGWYNGLRANNRLRAAHAPTGKSMEYDLGYQILTHTSYDDWWKERTAFDRLNEVDIPVFSIGHWGKLGLHLRGNINGYEEVRGPKKLLVTGARNVFEAHHMFDSIAFHEKELLPFYDYWLKGIDNGFMGGPPVKIHVRGDNEYREEDEWPPKRARHVSYYLRKGPSRSVTSLNDGGLSAEKPRRNEGSTSYSYPDWEWRSGVVALGPDGPDPVRRVLTFTTESLTRDIEVTGEILLELYAASDQPDMEFIVKLADQQPQSEEDRKSGRQPAFTNVSKGWLKASHREKDEKRSRPYRPFYTHADPQPIEPGEIYKFDIEVLCASYVFKKGHRIRLEIVNGDSPQTDAVFIHPLLLHKVGRDTIHHSAVRPSRIILPVIPRGR